MTKLDGIFKSRDITLLTNICIDKAMVFLVVMHRCESWLMLSNCGTGEDSRVSWTVRRSNQSILKETIPEYSLEGLMLKLEYFGLLMQRTDSLEETLMLGKIEGRR